LNDKAKNYLNKAEEIGYKVGDTNSSFLKSVKEAKKAFEEEFFVPARKITQSRNEIEAPKEEEY